MTVLQVFQALGQRLVFRVPGVLAQPARQLDRDLLGFLLGVGLSNPKSAAG